MPISVIMKGTSYFFTINAYILTICSITNCSRFMAVSSLVGFENYYIEPWFVYNEDDELNFASKAAECADVIGSPLFDTQYQVDPVDPTDEVVHSELREKYPNIYSFLYQQQNSSDDEIKYTNAYRQLDITVGKNVVHEQVITCLARDRSSKNITEFFISRTHLVSADRRHPDRMKGVFVFTAKEKIMVLIAVAEEPGYIIEPNDSRYNVSIMSRFEIADEIHPIDHEYHQIFEDTICTLTVHEKIRLCTLVMNAEGIREKVRFVPDVNNVESICYRGVVLLQNSSSAAETPHNDFMIGCKAIKSDCGSAEIYYVSAGFPSFDYFIFKEFHRQKQIIGGVSCRIIVRGKIGLNFS